MRIVAYDARLAELGGAQKHGLTLLAPLAARYPVTILYEQLPGEARFSPERVKQLFGIDPECFRFQEIPGRWSVLRVARAADLFVCLTHNCLIDVGARKQVVLVFFPSPLDDAPGQAAGPLASAWQRFQLRYHAALEKCDPDLFICSTRQYLQRLGLKGLWKSLPLLALRKLGRRRACYRYHLGRRELPRYDRVLANSVYTASWVRQYYGVESAIDYPPIDTAAFRRGAKEDVILSVGRFQPHPGSKKYEVMIEAFRSLVATGAAKGWRLVLAGSTRGGPGYEAYRSQLQSQAAGLPVTFATNISLDELSQWYARASLYCHAMGHGEDPQRHPIRYEHFGMTTVEAMAAGCVPLAIQGGGQPEIITEGTNGFLWSTVEELTEQFRRFTAMSPEEVERLRTNAQRRADDFGLKAYESRAIALYRELGIIV